MTQRSVGRSIVSVSEHAAGEDEQVCLFPTLVWGVASLRYKMGGKEEETKDRREAGAALTYTETAGQSGRLLARAVSQEIYNLEVGGQPALGHLVGGKVGSGPLQSLSLFLVRKDTAKLCRYRI